MNPTNHCRIRLHRGVFLLAALAQAAAIPAQASKQGTLGPTSTGDVNISVTKPAVVNVSGVSDLSATRAAAGSGVTWASDICVYSSLAAAGYRITATGSPRAGGAFVLANGENVLPYSVAWNAGGAGNLAGGGVPLSPGVPSALLANAAPSNAACQSATARLIVRVLPAALSDAGPGSYAESLTLLVAPN